MILSLFASPKTPGQGHIYHQSLWEQVYSVDRLLGPLVKETWLHPTATPPLLQRWSWATTRTVRENCYFLVVAQKEKEISQYAEQDRYEKAVKSRSLKRNGRAHSSIWPSHLNTCPRQSPRVKRARFREEMPSDLPRWRRCKDNRLSPKSSLNLSQMKAKKVLWSFYGSMLSNASLTSCGIAEGWIESESSRRCSFSANTVPRFRACTCRLP